MQEKGFKGPQAPSAEKTQLKHDALALLAKLAFLVLSLWLIFTFLFGFAVVQGEGMYPRLRDGDLTLFYRLDRDYVIGDVVAYRVDGTRYFGRVVASGGDTVNMTEDGKLLVNGSIQQENIFYDTYLPQDAAGYPLTVPEGGVYVLGDFRTGAVGQDSRTFGPLDGKTQTDGTVISLLRRRGL